MTETSFYIQTYTWGIIKYEGGREDLYAIAWGTRMSEHHSCVLLVEKRSANTDATWHDVLYVTQTACGGMWFNRKRTRFLYAPYYCIAIEKWVNDKPIAKIVFSQFSLLNWSHRNMIAKRKWTFLLVYIVPDTQVINFKTEFTIIIIILVVQRKLEKL